MKKNETLEKMKKKEKELERGNKKIWEGIKQIKLTQGRQKKRTNIFRKMKRKIK